MVTQEHTELLNVDEAAVLAKVSSITIRRAIAKGELHYRDERGAIKLLRAGEVTEWARKRAAQRGIERE